MKKLLFLICGLLLSIILIGCQTIEQGHFISLNDAIEQNLLTRNDFKYISYFYQGQVIISTNKNNHFDTNYHKTVEFQPSLATPEISDLNRNLQTSIRMSYLEFWNTGALNLRLRHVRIVNYLGTFNQMIIVRAAVFHDSVGYHAAIVIHQFDDLIILSGALEIKVFIKNQ
jgi:hypothetical protein